MLILRQFLKQKLTNVTTTDNSKLMVLTTTIEYTGTKEVEL